MSFYQLPDGTVVIAPPPENYTVDIEHPQRQYDIASYVGTGVVGFFTFLFVLQRYYVRFLVQKTFGFEDVLVFIAYGIVTALCALVIRALAVPCIGLHTWEVTLDRYVKFEHLVLFPFPVLYPPASLCAKTAMLMFYRRLSPQQWFQWAVYFSMFFVVASQGVLFFLATFGCKPIAKGWDLSLEGTCIDKTPVYEATAITGVISDIMLIVIPIPMVVKLQRPWRQKVGLLFLFSVGVVTIATSCIRLYYILTEFGGTDITWAIGPAGFWTLIECQMMVLCTTLGYLRLFVSQVAPSLLGSRSAQDSRLHGPTPPASNSGLVTIGGGGGAAARKGRNRSKYSRFNDTEYGLDTFAENTAEVKAGHRNSQEHSWEGGSGEDSGSQKGILQTRTVAVTQSPA